MTETAVMCRCTFAQDMLLAPPTQRVPKYDEESPTIALLFVDDQRLARKQVPKLYRDICATRNDPEQVATTLAAWNEQNSTCCTLDLLAIGPIPSLDGEIEKWAKDAVDAVYQVLGIVDQNLEYNRGTFVEGTDVIRELRAFLDIPRSRVTVAIRSGNDGEDDYEQYLEAGADGMISKTCAFAPLVKRLLKLARKSRTVA